MMQDTLRRVVENAKIVFEGDVEELISEATSPTTTNNGNNGNGDRTANTKRRILLSCIIRTALLFPPIAISCILLYSYFTFVYLLCIRLLIIERGKWEMAIIGMVLYHICFSFFTVSFLKTIFKDPGFVQRSSYHQKLEEDVIDTTDPVKYCTICKQSRPPRSHHCKHCKMCVLKKDHHCPVVLNCIGFRNQKYFVLMLLWVGIFAIVCGSFIIYKYITIGWTDNYFAEIQILVILITGVGYGISMFIFGGVHLKMILNNTTTVQELQARSHNIYDIGYSQNFIQVFGDKWYLWLVPVDTTIGDGFSWPTNDVDRAPLVL